MDFSQLLQRFVKIDTWVSLTCHKNLSNFGLLCLQQCFHFQSEGGGGMLFWSSSPLFLKDATNSDIFLGSLLPLLDEFYQWFWTSRLMGRVQWLDILLATLLWPDCRRSTLTKNIFPLLVVLICSNHPFYNEKKILKAGSHQVELDLTKESKLCFEMLFSKVPPPNLMLSKKPFVV